MLNKVFANIYYYVKHNCENKRTVLVYDRLLIKYIREDCYEMIKELSSIKVNIVNGTNNIVLTARISEMNTMVTNLVL